VCEDINVCVRDQSERERGLDSKRRVCRYLVAVVVNIEGKDERSG